MRNVPSDRADPELTAEVTKTLSQWSQVRAENRHPEFEAGDDARTKQKASRLAMQVNKAVVKYAREGLGPADFERMAAEAAKRAAVPIDQEILINKIGLATSQMVDLILSGECNPRSAAEAANVAETLTRIAGTLSIDSAALTAAASVAATVSGEATRDAFLKAMEGHIDVDG